MNQPSQLPDLSNSSSSLPPKAFKPQASSRDREISDLAVLAIREEHDRAALAEEQDFATMQHAYCLPCQVEEHEPASPSDHSIDTCYVSDVDIPKDSTSEKWLFWVFHGYRSKPPQ